jgi:cyclase
MQSTVAVPQAVAARLEELGEGVFAYVQPDGGWCVNNAGVIVGGDGALLVDTAATEERTLRLRSAVASITPLPVRTVVNTHSHGDHTFGNSVFEDALVIAHANCRTEMAAAGLHLCGLWPATPWGELSVSLPTVTFHDRATVHVGPVEVELLHVGPAHTTGDVVAWLPEQSVLFAGDLVMAGVTPFCMMGSVSGTLAALGRLRSLGARTIVPGHGPVGGPELLDAAEDHLRWLRGVAADGRARGLTVLQAAREADLGDFADLLDAERLVPNLHRAYAEEAGARPGEPLDVGAVFQEMVEFHGGLPACHA